MMNILLIAKQTKEDVRFDIYFELTLTFIYRRASEIRTCLINQELQVCQSSMRTFRTFLFVIASSQ